MLWKGKGYTGGEALQKDKIDFHQNALQKGQTYPEKARGSVRGVNKKGKKKASTETYNLSKRRKGKTIRSGRKAVHQPAKKKEKKKKEKKKKKKKKKGGLREPTLQEKATPLKKSLCDGNLLTLLGGNTLGGIRVGGVHTEGV